MTERVEQRAIISGIGISRIGRKTGLAGITLTAEASRQAIADAGLTPTDIDGIATIGDTPLDEVVADLGLDVGYTGGGFDTGGLLSPLMSAFVAVGSGRARHVLVYRTVLMMAGTIEAPPSDRDPDDESLWGVMGDMGPLLACHAYSAANWIGMQATRYMHLYGSTKEQLGWLAVNSRRNAALNPLAIYQEPMTIDDYMAARMISTPIGLYDCDVPVDGSIAIVVSAADHEPDCPNPAVRVASIGGSPSLGGWVDRPDYPAMAASDAAAQLWAGTDVRPGDVDIAEIYDGFTFLTFAWLEALGLCGRGEAGPFIEGATRIALDGQLPVNTYGGQLSAGRMHGYWVIHEAVLQLRGRAGPRQVAHPPEVAVTAAGGGPIAGAILLTR